MLYKHMRSKLTLILLLLFLVFSQSTYAYATPQYYQVEEGDTLYQIAGHFGVNVQELIHTNRIHDPRLLQIGQKLKISKSVNAITTDNQQGTFKVQKETQSQSINYQVMAGDTLYKIADTFKVTVQDLIRTNRIHDPRFLRIGQKLNIPSADPTTVKAMGGQEYSIKKVLNSTLTAYTAGFESTGKTSDHPEYGITYSGKKVQEGRTIAVDPSVIALGSTVYIEGIGLRKAEDIGSAIKGVKIDIFMEDLDEALEFGVKKNVKVYVLSDSS